jgi:hypothetical protein
LAFDVGFELDGDFFGAGAGARVAVRRATRVCDFFRATFFCGLALGAGVAAFLATVRTGLAPEAARRARFCGFLRAPARDRFGWFERRFLIVDSCTLQSPDFSDGGQA